MLLILQIDDSVKACRRPNMRAAALYHHCDVIWRRDVICHIPFDSA